MLLDTGSMPLEFQNINSTETRLISQRIQFMKIRSLPAGGQRGLKGAVVNVPIDAQESCLKLPRDIYNLGIVDVKIKRNIKHKTVILADTVNPDKIISFLKWLQKNNPIYKDSVLQDDWITENYHENQNFFNTHLSDNAMVVAMSVLNDLINNLCNDGPLPYEQCIQPKDPVQNFPKQVPTMEFAPGQHNTPIPLFSDPMAEPLSFPNLFPLGKGHFYDKNRLALMQENKIPKLSLKRYAEHRLYSSNRKFSQDPEWIFFIQGAVEREAIHSSITTHLRKSCKSTTDGIRLTAGLFKNNLISTEELLSDIDAFKFMKCIKGTPASWQRVKLDGVGMVSQLGIFTWFNTFSFNDLIYSIPTILRLMGIEPTDELLSDISWSRKHELLSMDPVIAVRMFDRYLHKIFSYLLEKRKVFGEVEAYFGRPEFGGRGSPHLHLMLKCKNAPMVGKDSVQDIIKYIDKYVTTHIPSKEEHPALHDLGQLQIHKHTATCKKGNTKSDCRFHFPRPVSKQTVIVDSNDEPIGDQLSQLPGKKHTRRQKVIHKREIGDEWVNPYNPTLLLAARSNIDVQFITSAWDLVNYLIGYATKAEKDVCSAMKEVKDNIEAADNASAREKLRSLGNTFIYARSVSIQEAIYRTTSLPMSISKPRVIFIPSDMPHQRHGMLKPKHRLSNVDDNSEDVFEKGIIDRYSQRPDNLAGVCYKEFACYYQKFYGKEVESNKNKIISLKNENLGRMIKRDTPLIVRSHNPPRAKDPEKYYYSKICLYFPWANESEIQGNFPTIEESFASKFEIIKSNMVKFEKISVDTLNEIFGEVEKEIRDSHIPDNSTQELDQRGMVSHPPSDLKKAEKEENFKMIYEEPPISDEEYRKMVRSLNTRQLEVFTTVKRHVARVWEGKKSDQFISFLSGAGGVGKTFLLTVLRHCINRSLKQPSCRSAVLVSASTGAAAALIDGQTVHQLLQLDCQESGFFQTKPLNSAKRDKMFNNVFQHVKYLIVDEVSMIGNTNLNQIHSRLNQLYGKSAENDFFGGINVIFVGDLFQIPPVQQSKIFDPRGIAKLGTNLWKDLVTFSELTEVVRSKGDSAFTALCHRVRIGKHTSDDINLLKSRVIEKLPPISELMKTMLLFSTNKKCKVHNDNCTDYLRTITDVFKINSVDKFSDEEMNSDIALGHGKKNIKDYICDDINKTAGLPTSIMIGIGARVMVRSNIDVTQKICNGVTGTVKHIKYKKSALPPQPDKVDKTLMCHSATDIEAVYIKFDNDKVGPSTIHKCSKFCSERCLLPGTVPIKPLEKQFKCKKASKTNVWLKRYQLPLTLCFASTIHKCQGVTLQNAFIDMSGVNWKAGMAYTAISRLTSLSGLFLLSFDQKSIKTDQTIVKEYSRLRSLPPFKSDDNNNSETDYDDSGLTLQTLEMDIQFAVPNIDNTSCDYVNTTSPPIVDTPDIPLTVDPHVLSEKRSLSKPASPARKHRKIKPCETVPLNLSYMEPHRPLNYIGRAYVIDFFGDQQSTNVSNQLRDLGFQVRECIENIQYSVSCGYIASRIVAKLAKNLTTGADWFTTTFLDCNYFGPDYNNNTLDMVIAANIHLGVPGTSPHFLSSSQCVDLIPFYSLLFYNNNLPVNELHTLNIEQPVSISTFNSKLSHLCNLFFLDAKTTPPLFFIVNSTDGAGTHWFTVALQFEATELITHNEF